MFCKNIYAISKITQKKVVKQHFYYSEIQNGILWFRSKGKIEINAWKKQTKRTTNQKIRNPSRSKDKTKANHINYGK